ncbi:MAG: hypothetical protein JWO06_1839 [Bacteroidota bacterium]|nr:hypothetical protein [Bacteroidota bacterium]
MKKSILAALVALVFFAGCKKTDNAANWVGTYTDKVNNNIQQIVIMKVDRNTIEIQLQKTAGNTFLTLKSVALADATSAKVNENGNLPPDLVTIYHFSGSAILSGNDLTFFGNSVSTIDSTNTQSYSFNGSK